MLTKEWVQNREQDAFEIMKAWVIIVEELFLSKTAEEFQEAWDIILAFKEPMLDVSETNAYLMESGRPIDLPKLPDVGGLWVEATKELFTAVGRNEFEPAWEIIQAIKPKWTPASKNNVDIELN